MTRPTTTAVGPVRLGAAWARRWPERQLLLATSLSMTLGFLMVLGASYADGRAFDPLQLLPMAIYLVSLAAVHLSLVAAGFRGDQILLAALAFLVGFGLLAQSRMGILVTTDPTAPGLYLFPGGMLLMLLCCLGLMRGRFVWLSRVPWVWAGLSLLVLAVLLAVGERYRGAVYAAGLITPTEILKVTVVLFLASFIDRHAKALSGWSGALRRPLLLLLGFWALLVALLLVQRDLGMIIILSLSLLLMLVTGTARLSYLLLGIGAAGAAGYLVLEFFSHGQRRVAAWLSPFDDPTGGSWQILQGLSGMYSGGLWGEGFGEGRPDYTPIAQADFIYSVIGEELGFAGCSLLVLIFLIFFGRALGIADQSRSRFGQLLCIGLVSVLATQTFLNLGGVTKFIPLTGITLPFISHGGSSLLTGFIGLGLILAVSDGMPQHSGRARGPANNGGNGAAAAGPRPPRGTVKRARRATGADQSST